MEVLLILGILSDSLNGQYLFNYLALAILLYKYA